MTRSHTSPRYLSRIAIVATAAGTMLLSACASIIHGTTQDVGFSSVPTGAQVEVDNKPVGTAPVISKLTRKDNHTITITLAGYKPYETTVTRSVSGWVWGNLVFGGLVGLAVDAISGGIYKLTPEQVNSSLTADSAQLIPAQDGVYIVAVLKPENDWIKVAQLERK